MKGAAGVKGKQARLITSNTSGKYILTFYDMPEIKPSKGLSTASACILQNIIQRNRCLKSSCRSCMSCGMRFEQCYINTCPFQDRLDPSGHSLCSHRIMWLNSRNKQNVILSKFLYRYIPLNIKGGKYLHQEYLGISKFLAQDNDFPAF